MARGLIIGVIVVILLIGGLYWLMSDFSKSVPNPQDSQENNPPSNEPSPPSMPEPESETGSENTPQTYNIDIENFEFSPPSLTINVGDTIIWTNIDSSAHTATADNGEFDSDRLSNGESYSFTFINVGAYPYICSIHSSMKGTIIVE